MFKVNLKKRDNILFLNEEPFVHMQHTNGRSAEYRLEIKQLGSPHFGQEEYALFASYGKIGTNLKRQKLYSSIKIADVRKMFEKKMSQELKKGYVVIKSTF